VVLIAELNYIILVWLQLPWRSMWKSWKRSLRTIHWRRCTRG